MVFNGCLARLGRREDAEEATQDVFLRIHRGLSGFEGRAALKTWIWRIVINVCASRVRKRQPFYQDAPLTEQPAASLSDDGLIANERRGIVVQAMSRLPVRERDVLQLFYFESLSYQEIADVLAVPIGTVGTAMHRGRERLRGLLPADFRPTA